MLDPQYLQESTTEIDDNLTGDPIPEDLIKSEFPHVFGPPTSPASTTSLTEKTEIQLMIFEIMVIMILTIKVILRMTKIVFGMYWRLRRFAELPTESNAVSL